MKKLLALILALLMLVAVFASCDGDESSSSSESSLDSSESSSSQESSSKPSSSESSSTEDEDKYPAVPKIDYNVNVNQTVNTNIFKSLDDFGNEGEAEAYSNPTEMTVSGITNINTPGVYKLTGTTTKGYIKVDIERASDDAELEDVILILDNVSITSYPDASSIPPIYSKGCNLTIILPKGSTNTITDTKTNLEKGAIYVKTGNLTIEGEGTLKVTAVHKNAIFNTKNLTINGGVFEITSEYSGIYGELGLTVNSGDFTITSGKSALKSGEYEIDNLPEQNVLGSITLNGGKLLLDTIGNAIDCYGDVNVNGGGYDIKSEKDGINATGKIVFGGDETNTVMIIEAGEDGIKIKSEETDTAESATENEEAEVTIEPNVKIEGKTNIKILCDNDGIDADDIEINMNGVLYIKTNATFVEDMSSGDYILDKKEYYKVDRTLYSGKAFFSIDGSVKGVSAKNSIVIKNGQIGIDADEDAIVSTDGKNGNSKTVNTITISGGSINLTSRESAIKADNDITISDNAKINIIKSDKGLNARNVEVKDGTVIAVAISDAIDAKQINVSGGTVYIFDKVDYPTDGGVFTVTGGTVVCMSTTKNPKAPTSATSKVIATSIESCADYVFGNYINIKGTGLDIVLKIPKSYAEKLSVVVVSPNIVAGQYTVSAGSYANGSISNLVCTNGEFVASASQSVTVE